MFLWQVEMFKLGTIYIRHYPLYFQIFSIYMTGTKYQGRNPKKEMTGTRQDSLSFLGYQDPTNDK